MKKRLISILLALCMVLALVPGTAGASIDDESYSYKTTITTSNVTVGRDNYSCDVSMTTGEIMPHICKVVDNRLQKFAVLHDGDAITVYPNKYGTTSNGKYIYVDASVGSGYVYEKYIVFKEDNPEPPKPEDPITPKYLTAHFSGSATSATIQEDEAIDVQWTIIIDATEYVVSITDKSTGIGWSCPATTGASETLTGLTAGTYEIQVLAVGSVSRSNVLTLTVTKKDSNVPETPDIDEPSKPDGDTPTTPDTPSQPGNIDSEKMEVVKKITGETLKGVAQSKQDEINRKIYDLLCSAQFRPDYATVSVRKIVKVKGYDPFGVYGSAESQRAVNAEWPAPNIKKPGADNWPDPSADPTNGWVAYIYDEGLAKKLKVGDGKKNSKGCFAHCNYASMYVYGSLGRPTEAIRPSDEDREGKLKDLIKNFADPGEHIRINRIHNGQSPHSVVFLGSDESGFFCTSYGDAWTGDPPYSDGIKGPTIAFCYYTYEGFIDRYGDRDICIHDTNNGHLPRENEGSRLDGSLHCPVDASITLGAETLNSTPLKDGETCTTSFGSMTRSGEGIDFSIDYRTDYDFQIWGTGNRTMTLTLNYYSGTELRNTQRFVSVPITPTTRITTSSFNMSGEFSLRVDSDEITGTVWSAGVNETVTEPETLSPPDSYYVSTPAPQNGTLTVSKHTAAPGDWVNIYATPNAGYRLDSLTATDHRGWPVTVREMGENAFSFTMPAARVTVNAVFTKAAEEVPFPTEDSSATGPDTAAGSPGYVDVILNPSPMNFTDVSAADWFYNDVRFCWQHYLMTGVSDTRFDPQGATNRVMIWTVIARLAGRDTSGGSIWYERGQIWAKNKGITDGADPLADVTREQLVTMLWRFKGSPHVNTGNLLQFKDAAEVSGWAVQPVRWAVANGLLNGAFGSLNSQGKATRAEVAAILTRFCQFAG